MTNNNFHRKTIKIFVRLLTSDKPFSISRLSVTGTIESGTKSKNIRIFIGNKVKNDIF